MKKVIITIFILILIPLVAIADCEEGTCNMMDWYGWGAWGMAFVPLIWLVIIGVGIVLISKNFTSKNNTSDNKSKSAIEILNERYAKGEINKEQFLEIKKGIAK